MKINEKKNIKMSLVVPVFNESEAIEIFLREVINFFKSYSKIKIEIIFVNDGSTDSTLVKLLHIKKISYKIKIIDFSRNFGKEAALSAGIAESTGDFVIPIDVDLQDPIEIIPKMIEKWKDGFDVVLGRRVNRDSDPFMKRVLAKMFYYFNNKISDIDIPENVGDFRLMDRKVVNAINKMNESRRFMKGLFAWVGYKTTSIDYVRKKRIAGKTKFKGWSLWNLAIESITGFSTLPLRVWTYIGFLISLISFSFAFYIICKAIFFGINTPGYASLVVIISFLGGIQLIGIGVIGEYIGRIYIETKKRPIYIIKNIY